jgi:L-asparaginase II
MDALVPLIELQRAGLRESLHFGAVAVANHHGQLLARAGNAHLLAYTRSTLKPFQALALLEDETVRHFDYTPEHIALLCASHSGEAMHVTVVEEMLAKCELNRHALRCGCHVPGFYSLLDEAPPAGLYFDERHHNCSGKHAGFLAYCVQHGLPTANYTEPDHPLQLTVARNVARAAGMDLQDLHMGIDGCSAPNYAMPLWRLAYAYARMARPDEDPHFGASFAALGQAMTQHPELVSGSGRNDLAFTRAGRGDWICKVGADGVQVVASRSRGEALAIKVSDGNKTALYACAVEVLDQLGWLDDAQRETLHPWRASVIVNARGQSVGERRSVFALAPP